MRKLSQFEEAVELLKNPKEFGLTQKVVAEKMGLTRQTIKNYAEHPETIPLERMPKLSEIFHDAKEQQSEILQLLKHAETTNQRFERTQNELIALIESGLKNTEASDYTKRVARTLEMELRQNNSEFLQVLMSRMSGWGI
ncbi:helix-turn-helix transcriptional regulator [uncultured Limosilactobacillus sp.]|uniref:helix-turn-helix domain-containing protein n=1 Tax=uncultured Limosilactobacillus sp. TaxID=2837629 RepID=UPI0025E2373A|nr:helix-turn-helix transcriptional regulator [uncultured Limosilactobacillus sp.]